MEKKAKGIVALGCLSVLAMGALIGVAANKEAATVNNVLTHIRAARTPVDFSEETITRRVWIVNADDWHWSNHYVHIWVKANDSFNTDINSSNWVDFSGETSYYAGIGFVDVTLKGVGGQIGVSVRNQESWDGCIQTVDNTLPGLNESGADVVFLNAGLTDGKRNSEVKTAPMSTGQLVKVLNEISTCEANYQNGYNAYPQLNKDFFVPSQGQIDQYGTTTLIPDEDVEHHTGYNLKNKIDKLSELYDANGWIVE